MKQKSFGVNIGKIKYEMELKWMNIFSHSAQYIPIGHCKGLFLFERLPGGGGDLKIISNSGVGGIK